MLFSGDTAKELLRYAATGLASNGALYAAYLVLSAWGLDPKIAMTVTYTTSVGCTFLLNKRWTFDHRGAMPPALIRYVTLYALGYVVNLCALTVAVDLLGLPHQAAMAVLIVASAIVIFLAQKYWVFPADMGATSASQSHSTRTS